MTTCKIAPFAPCHAAAFESLNREWIETLFRIEAEDLRVLQNPIDNIIRPGGDILMLLDGDQPVGTVALIPHGSHPHGPASHDPDTSGPATSDADTSDPRPHGQGGELAKMAITASHRGRGFGKMLCQAAIARARDLGWTELTLETNSVLAPAIATYSSLGFRHIPLDPDSQFTRADVRMRLIL